MDDTERQYRITHALALVLDVEARGLAQFDGSTLSRLARAAPFGTEDAIDRAAMAAGLECEWRDLRRRVAVLPDGLPWDESNRWQSDTDESRRDVLIEVGVRLLTDRAIESALRMRAT